WKYIIEEFKKDHPIVHWHYRGHGQSAVPTNLETMSAEVVARDLKQVLDSLKIKKAIFCGHSMGVQILLEAYMQIKSRVLGFVFLCGAAGHPIKTWHASFKRNGPKTAFNLGMQVLFTPVTQAMISLSDILKPVWTKAVYNPLSFKIVQHLELNPSRVTHDDFGPYLKGLANMEAKVFAQMARGLAKHTGVPILKHIKHPTLIVSGAKDTFAPPWLLEDMHQSIENSEFLLIPDGSHTTPIEHPDLISLRIEKFLRERILRA
ncbi:alpha/beta hydrolase, partial [Sulfobacillus acidophilus]|nr:alpha/beta hydrolase [Sulfobacillus acidophilus]